MLKLNPVKSNQEWDSRNTIMDLEKFGKSTIHSLRTLLAKPFTKKLPHPEEVKSENLKPVNVEELWEDQDSNIKEGITRSVLHSMLLRDQPILDQFQDDIFRMRLDSRCFLSGPPGTGKTTTLIKRLGQKTDIFVEKEFEQENRLADEVERDTNIPHEKSWYLFSPTDLLKQYVKEAAAREALPATDQEMYTWIQFSRKIARDKSKPY